MQSNLRSSEKKYTRTLANERTVQWICWTHCAAHPTHARSVVELSLSPHFQSQYPSIYTAIASSGCKDIDLAALVGSYLPPPKKRAYWLFGVDGTPQRRRFAYTLSDRSYVYYPNPVSSNKPITIGHEYSTVALLPESDPQMAKSWVVPLSTRRAGTDDDKEQRFNKAGNLHRR